MDDPNEPMLPMPTRMETEADKKNRKKKFQGIHKGKPVTDKQKKRDKQAADETMDINMAEGKKKYKKNKAKGYAKGGMVKGDFKTPGGLNSRGNGAARRGNRGS
jgi:hypothetical protein